MVSHTSVGCRHPLSQLSRLLARQLFLWMKDYVLARLEDSLRVALPVRRERLAAGTVQRELAEHAVVVRCGSRPDRLRAMVGAALRGQALRQLS